MTLLPQVIMISPQMPEILERAYSTGWLKPSTEPPLNLNTIFYKRGKYSAKFAADNAKRELWLKANPDKTLRDWRRFYTRQWRGWKKAAKNDAQWPEQALAREAWRRDHPLGTYQEWKRFYKANWAKEKRNGRTP